MYASKMYAESLVVGQAAMGSGFDLVDFLGHLINGFIAVAALAVAALPPYLRRKRRDVYWEIVETFWKADDDAARDLENVHIGNGRGAFFFDELETTSEVEKPVLCQFYVNDSVVRVSAPLLVNNVAVPEGFHVYGVREQRFIEIYFMDQGDLARAIVLLRSNVPSVNHDFMEKVLTTSVAQGAWRRWLLRSS